MKMPWEKPDLPAVLPEAPVPRVVELENLVQAMRRDFAYAVRYTALTVHSSNPAFRFTVNTERGQIVPRGEFKFADGTTVEIQDIGMCQPDTGVMAVSEVVSQILETAKALGLEFTP